MWQILLFSIIALGIGLVLLLWGFRAFLVLLPIFGFFAGFWLGAHAISAIFGGGFLADVTGFVAGVVIGLILAVFSYLFYAIGIAIVAAAIGYGLGAGLMQAIGLEAWWIVVPVGIVLAIVVLVLTFAFNLQEYVITVLTAIAGANAILLAMLTLIGRVSLAEIQGAGSTILPVLQDSWFWLLVWILLAIVGVVYQLRSNQTYTFTSDEYATGWG